MKTAKRILYGIVLAIVLIAQAPIFTFISTIDCVNSSCMGALLNGDTPVYGAWGGTGNFVYNGVTIPGSVLGTFNDGSVTGCGASNSIAVVKLNGVDFATPSNGSISLVNCMSSFGLGANKNWPPAAFGTCSATHVNGCGWASVGNTRVNGNTYLYVYRQDNGTNAALDATIVMSTDDGVTWANPVHLGSPNANGDAPTGPGSADYPANILFPSIGPSDGSGNHRTRLAFVRYCKDESGGCPSIDNNATYVYAVNTNGDYQGQSFMRITKTTILNLVTADWEYYLCPGYATTPCSITSSGSWTSNPLLQTNIPSIILGADPMVVWDNSKNLYYAVGFGGVNGTYYLSTASHLEGPWTFRTSFIPDATCVSAGCSVFTNIVMPTLASVDSNNSRMAVVRSMSTCCGGMAHFAEGSVYVDLLNFNVGDMVGSSIIGKTIVSGKTTVH